MYARNDGYPSALRQGGSRAEALVRNPAELSALYATSSGLGRTDVEQGSRKEKQMSTENMKEAVREKYG
jgi:hypothetical protein